MAKIVVILDEDEEGNVTELGRTEYTLPTIVVNNPDFTEEMIVIDHLGNGYAIRARETAGQPYLDYQPIKGGRDGYKFTFEPEAREPS